LALVSFIYLELSVILKGKTELSHGAKQITLRRSSHLAGTSRKLSADINPYGGPELFVNAMKAVKPGLIDWEWR
jgi:hypothetical protein